MRDKTNLFLFAKEIPRGGYPYRLYFADAPTLEQKHPCLREMTCLSPKIFRTGALGKIYNVSARRNFLNTMAEAGELEISDDIFQKLVKERNTHFKRQAPPSPFSRFYATDSYYSFHDTKEIMAFTPGVIKKFCCSSLQTMLHLISFIVPFILFIYSLVHFLRDLFPLKFARPDYYLLPPFFYFVSIPFMIYLMTLFSALSDTFIFHNEEFRWILIQKRVYRNGCINESEGFGPKQKSRLFMYGIVFGGIYLLFWLIILLL